MGGGSPASISYVIGGRGVGMGWGVSCKHSYMIGGRGVGGGVAGGGGGVGGLLQAFLCDRWAGGEGGGGVGGLLQTFLCDRWARGVFCNLSYVSVCARCGNMGRGVRDKDAKQGWW